MGKCLTVWPENWRQRRKFAVVSSVLKFIVHGKLTEYRQGSFFSHQDIIQWYKVEQSNKQTSRVMRKIYNFGHLSDATKKKHHQNNRRELATVQSDNDYLPCGGLSSALAYALCEWDFQFTALTVHSFQPIDHGLTRDHLNFNRFWHVYFKRTVSLIPSLTIIIIMITTYKICCD